MPGCPCMRGAPTTSHRPGCALYRAEEPQRCVFCDRTRLDGHLTCGSASCSESAARERRDQAWRDRRCESNLVGLWGECIACGAVQGEACLKPARRAGGE